VWRSAKGCHTNAVCEWSGCCGSGGGWVSLQVGVEHQLQLLHRRGVKRVTEVVFGQELAHPQ
jgi:hypothetical protein